jgi:hypothetical protein
MVKTFCLIVVISANIVHSQNYFPMQLSNKYQVQELIHSHLPTGGGSYSRLNDLKLLPLQDTMINNIHFFRFNYMQSYKPLNPNCFYGYDTLQNILYAKCPGDDTLRIAVDFNVPKDSLFVSYISGSPHSATSAGKFTDNVMGDTLPCFAFNSNYELVRKSYYFGSGIGLYASKHFEFGGEFTSDINLISAIIDTNIFNPITLKITSLSPLINRPLNTFPFVMHGIYQTNLDVTDTFKLLYQYQRDSLVYYSGSVIFNSADNINILLPPDAAPGDILKVRAEISDTSIFNNFASYPDTGYASILILAPTDVNDATVSYSFQLEQNYPNPFNPSTTIRYQIPKSGFVNLKVYDVLGNEVAVLVNENKSKGNYNLTFNASGLAAGVYIYLLKVNDYVSSKKMILLK